MIGGSQHVAVVGFEERLFVLDHFTNEQGLSQVCAIAETSREPAVLGRAVRLALNSHRPDIWPDPNTLIKGLAGLAGVSSYTRFVARSGYASVSQRGTAVHVVALRPDGRAGYTGVDGTPEYDLHDPDDSGLGDAVLSSIRDSFSFPGRPRVR